MIWWERPASSRMCEPCLQDTIFSEWDPVWGRKMSRYKQKWRGDIQQLRPNRLATGSSCPQWRDRPAGLAWDGKFLPQGIRDSEEGPEWPNTMPQWTMVLLPVFDTRH
eukprot:757255-Hanusia_phi.AAC.1